MDGKKGVMLEATLVGLEQGDYGRWSDELVFSLERRKGGTVYCDLE